MAETAAQLYRRALGLLDTTAVRFSSASPGCIKQDIHLGEGSSARSPNSTPRTGSSGLDASRARVLSEGWWVVQGSNLWPALATLAL